MTTNVWVSLDPDSPKRVIHQGPQVSIDGLESHLDTKWDAQEPAEVMDRTEWQGTWAPAEAPLILHLTSHFLFPVETPRPQKRHKPVTPHDISCICPVLEQLKDSVCNLSLIQMPGLQV